MAQMKSRDSLIIFVLIITFSYACMIINCPRGGKRSGKDSLMPLRNCARCGPNNTGHCYGPSICCSEAFGCLLGSIASKPCEEEAASPEPCIDAGLGPRCLGGRGFCAARGICCSQTSCHMDIWCNFFTASNHIMGTLDRGVVSHKDELYSLLADLTENTEEHPIHKIE